MERLRLKTHIPIVRCWLEHEYNDISRKDYLIGYFLEIFSNLYSFNLSTYFELNQKVPYLQDVKCKTFHNNINLQLLDDHSLIHYEYPMLLSKYQDTLVTVNLSGKLKIFDP